MDHLDVVVPHQARGGGGGQGGVGLPASHAGVHHSGWGLEKGSQFRRGKVIYMGNERVNGRLKG